MLKKPEGTIRLATFNAKHGAFENGYRGNPELTALMCASLDADILALQEVDRYSVRSGFRDLIPLVEQTSGLTTVSEFSRAMRFIFGSYGNALFVRGKMEDVTRLRMRGGHRIKREIAGHRLKLRHEPRSAIFATAVIDDRRISVGTTHLATEKSVSHEQLGRVLGSLACRDEPLVLLGDFNRTRGQMAVHGLLDIMNLVEAPPTFPASNPRKQIDHIALLGLEVCQVQTEQLPVSDHRALIVDVR